MKNIRFIVLSIVQSSAFNTRLSLLSCVYVSLVVCKLNSTDSTLYTRRVASSKYNIKRIKKQNERYTDAAIEYSIYIPRLFNFAVCVC